MNNDTKESQSLRCTSCGVPWVDHMGIIGTCAENIKLRKEVLELLAVIHRDGGHHTDAVGIEASIQDAIKKFYDETSNREPQEVLDIWAENETLKKENNELRFVVAKLEKESKEWNLRLQDPEPIQVLSVSVKPTTQNKNNEIINALYKLHNVSDLAMYGVGRNIMIDVIDEINRLHNERDEARRLYCVMAANVMYKSENKSTAEHIANYKNWDCYESDTLSQEVSQERGTQ